MIIQILHRQVVQSCVHQWDKHTVFQIIDGVHILNLSLSLYPPPPPRTSSSRLLCIGGAGDLNLDLLTSHFDLICGGGDLSLCLSP